MTMKTIIIAASAALSLATGAFAQTAPHGSDHNPAVKDSDPAKVAVAADGANSFTEDQARGRLAEAGYTGVGKLAKDKDGVWRGTALRGGARVQVALDHKGNVTTR
jgi:putative membrane protein